MDDRSAMEVFESFGCLVDDEANVYIFEDAFGDDVVEIGLHVLEEKVDVFVVVSSDRLVEFYYVGVVKLF